VGLFFLAFLPQFISPAAEMPALQILYLGCFFSLSGTVIIGGGAGCLRGCPGKNLRRALVGMAG
ncbi:MAG: hypothetical protein MI743_15320, partial [Sneathiellales bacterium]|nr:hypothetical protein [Sneathiellales bacterium]